MKLDAIRCQSQTTSTLWRLDSMIYISQMDLAYEDTGAAGFFTFYQDQVLRRARG